MMMMTIIMMIGIHDPSRRDITYQHYVQISRFALKAAVTQFIDLSNPTDSIIRACSS